MPEAPVNEHHDTTASENKIGTSDQATPHSVPETDSPKRQSKRQLGRRVAVPDLRHTPTSLLTGENIGHYSKDTRQQCLVGGE